MASLDEKKVAFLATDGVEQIELTEPWKAVEEAGGTPELISLQEGTIQGFEHLDKGDEFDVDRAVADVSAGDYDGLVLPGGVANPDFLRDRTLTSFPSLKTDIRNAGGNWVDEEVHVDGGLVSSRNPDLPAFCSKLVEEFAEGEHDARPRACRRRRPAQAPTTVKPRARAAWA